MNLLDKIWLGLLTFTTLTIFSCEDPSEVGLGLDPNGLKSGLFYEEIVLPAQNVFIDSLVTNSDVRMLVGNYTDSIYGTTNALSYNRLSTSSILTALTFEIDSETTDTTYSEKYIVDSAVLTLQYHDIKTINANNSITSQQTIKVQQIGDQLFSSVNYLSTYDMPLLPVEAGNEFQVSFRLDSLENETVDTVKLYLANSWAESLFDIFVEDNTNDVLFNEFKGIAISGDENNSSLISFTPGGETALRVHYHIEAIEKGTSIGDSIYNSFDSLSTIFSLTTTARFNGVIHDYSSSIIGPAIRDDLESFDVGDGNIYLNSLAGVYPKIDMQPYLDFLSREENEFIQINSFEFDLPTYLNSALYDKNAENIRFLLTGENNKINTAGLLSGDLFTTAVLSDLGYLSGFQDIMTASLDSTSLSYIGVGTFFSQEIKNEEIEIDNLILMPSDLTMPRHSVISQDGIKLKVFYSIPN